MPRPKLTTAEVNRRLRPRKLRLVGDWVNATTPHTYHCDVCGHEWPTVGTHILHSPTRGCPACTNAQRRRKELLVPHEVQRRLDEVCQEIVGGVWEGHHAVHTFRCLLCLHERNVTGNSPLGKHRGCPECARRARLGRKLPRKKQE